MDHSSLSCCSNVNGSSEVEKGTLTGRVFQIMAGGAVIYAFTEAGLDVARQITGGVTYELDLKRSTMIGD